MKSAFAALTAACLLTVSAFAHAQTQCWAPRDEQDASQKPQATTLRKAALAAEDIVRRDKAYLDSHLPVRMRTMIAIGPAEFTSARMIVNAYPEYSTAGLHVWRGQCDVIPQADRVDAAVGQIAVFFNRPADVLMPPGATFMPKFEGMAGGYPRYNGWIFITRDGRLPWIPETLGRRLDREIAARERTLADWMKDPVRTRQPEDPAKVQKTYETFMKQNPKTAELYLSTANKMAEQIRHNLEEVYPARTRQLEKAVADARNYRAGFSARELAAPAVWSNPLDLNTLRPGDREHASGFIADPDLFDKKNPYRIRLIALLFSTGSRPGGPEWMKRAQENFDFSALAALLD